MDELNFIEDVLNEVSELVFNGYRNRSQLRVSSKNGPNDVLTQVDTNVQERIVSRVLEQFPSDRIVAEEDGLTQLPNDTSVRTWFIDPIDGTQNFVRGFFPAFGISIGFAVGTNVCAGGVCFPVQKQILLAATGQGAYLNGEQLSVSTTREIGMSRIEVDFSSPEWFEQAMKTTRSLILAAGQVRTFSCAVVGLRQVAAGEQDAYVIFGENPWDIAAGQIIVEEAGGTVSRLNGQRVCPFDGMSGAIISNGIIHHDCLAHVQSSLKT